MGSYVIRNLIIAFQESNLFLKNYECIHFKVSVPDLKYTALKLA